MMIDTHCHLDDENFENINDVINKMNGNYMIAAGCDKKTNNNVIDKINKYDNIYGVIGVHPEEIKNININYLDEIKKIANENKKIVGIGEIGLDYYWTKDNKNIQKEFFIKQIEIANELHLTIVVHSRDSIEDTYEILKKYLKTNCVIHCFSGSLEMANKFISLGCYLGIGGVLTFKNSNKIKDVVKNIPLSSILLETDSPYLAPEPLRGTKNEPYNIIYVAKKIAEIKNIDEGIVLETTFNNSKKIFNLKI